MTADGHSTDPRWRKDGGLPEPQHRVAGRVDAYDLRVDLERQAALPGSAPVHDSWRWAPRSDTCASGEPGIAGTITPPTAEPLPPYVRSRIETALRLMEEAVAEMRRVRDGRP